MRLSLIQSGVTTSYENYSVVTGTKAGPYRVEVWRCRLTGDGIYTHGPLGGLTAQ